MLIVTGNWGQDWSTAIQPIQLHLRWVLSLHLSLRIFLIPLVALGRCPVIITFVSLLPQASLLRRHVQQQTRAWWQRFGGIHGSGWRCYPGSYQGGTCIFSLVKIIDHGLRIWLTHCYWFYKLYMDSIGVQINVNEIELNPNAMSNIVVERLVIVKLPL